MSKVRIIIVEDESIVAKDIKISLIKLDYDVVEVFSKGENLIDRLIDESIKNVDLVLMDIMLKGKYSGIETSAIIHEKFQIPVVFLTAYADENTINKAKLTEPYGYIIKPFKEIDLRTSIEMALYKFKKEKEKEKSAQSKLDSISISNSKNKDFIYVKSNSRLLKVINNEILYIEALKDYVVIHTLSDKYTIHSTMKDIANKLPDAEFQRIHRSYIVNLKKIKAIEMPNIILDHADTKLPVGGSYKEGLFDKINLV